MAKKSKTTASDATQQSAEDRALDRFAELMIEKIESIQGDWKKPWFTEGALQWPKNLSGRQYNGMNALMLMMQSEKQGYRLPVWMTFDRVASLNVDKHKDGTREQARDKDGQPLPHVGVNKGEKSFPVFLTTFTVVNPEDKSRIPFDDYKNLNMEERSKYNVYPKMHVYNVFNVSQTNLQEARPELWAKLEQDMKGPEKNPQDQEFCLEAVDTMITDDLWICPIKPKYGDEAYYSISKNEIVVPEKKQFVDGGSFYSNLFHEMGHSTGAEQQLGRLKPVSFGTAEYAREELVAELTAALVATNYGISKHVKDDSAAYLKNWLSSLRESPDFIKTVLQDVKKASSMEQTRIDHVQKILDESREKGIQPDFKALKAEDNKVSMTPMPVAPVVQPQERQEQTEERIEGEVKESQSESKVAESVPEYHRRGR